MFRASRRLSTMLPTCAGLLIGLGALACSDRRADDTTRTSTEYGSAATPAADSSLLTTGADSNAAPSLNRADGSTGDVPVAATPRRSTRSTTAATPATTPDDPYAANREDVARAEPVEPARTDVARTDDRTDIRRDSAGISVGVNRDSANANVTMERADVARADLPAVGEPTDLPDSAKPSEDDRIDANRSAEANRTGQLEPRGNVDVAAAAGTSDSVSRSQLENAGVLPKGPTLNDHQVFNIVLLTNAGDSARAAELLFGAANARMVATAEVATGDVPAPPTPAGAVVTTERTEVRSDVDCSTVWPSRNQHDDPKPRNCPEAEARPVSSDRPMESAAAPAAAAPAAQAPIVESDQSKAPVTSYDAGQAVAPPAPSDAAGAISMDAVRQLAETMLRDHTALNARAAAVVQRDNIAPSESSVSVDVFNSNNEIKADDQTSDPAARAWLEREVRLHEEALARIESQLLPLAADDELKSLLEDERQKIQSHLMMARQLLGTAGSTAAPAPPTPADSAAATDTVQVRLNLDKPRIETHPNHPAPDTTGTKPEAPLPGRPYNQ